MDKKARSHSLVFVLAVFAANATLSGCGLASKSDSKGKNLSVSQQRELSRVHPPKSACTEQFMAEVPGHTASDDIGSLPTDPTDAEELWALPALRYLQNPGDGQSFVASRAGQAFLEGFPSSNGQAYVPIHPYLTTLIKNQLQAKGSNKIASGQVGGISLDSESTDPVTVLALSNVLAASLEVINECDAGRGCFYQMKEGARETKKIGSALLRNETELDRILGDMGFDLSAGAPSNAAAAKLNLAAVVSLGLLMHSKATAMHEGEKIRLDSLVDPQTMFASAANLSRKMACLFHEPLPAKAVAATAGAQATSAGKSEHTIYSTFAVGHVTRPATGS